MKLRDLTGIFTPLLLLTILGCGPQETKLTGLVQKGEFSELELTAYPISDTGVLGLPIVSRSNTSEYTIFLPDNGFYQLEARGTFLNEITGADSTLNSPLLSIIEISDAVEQSNINLLTDLEAKQTLARVAAGEDIDDALEESTAFVQQTLSIQQGTDFSALNIYEVTVDSPITDPNLQLVLISGASLQAVEDNIGDTLTFAPEIADFGRFENVADAAEALSTMTGSSAASIYQIVQPNTPSLPINLPAIDTGDLVFNCVASSCGWSGLGRTLSLMGSNLLESQGKLNLSIELSSRSVNPTQVILRSFAGKADPGTDYIPVSKTINIPGFLLKYSLDEHLIIDLNNETVEDLRYEIEVVSSGITPLVGSKTINIIDGFGGVENPDGFVAIESICLSAIGDGLNIESNGCLTSGLSALPQKDTATIGVDLSLRILCDQRDRSQCYPQGRDWLVNLSIEAINLAGRVERNEVIGRYLFPGKAISIIERITDIKTAYVHINENTSQLLDEVRENNWTVKIRAKLADIDLANNSGITATIQTPIILPEQITAGDYSLDYQLINITQTAQCNGDNYSITAQFSLDGENYNESTVCVAINSTSLDGITASLTNGSSVVLGNNKIPLPAFHSSHIAFGDSRVQTLGADYLVVPQLGTNGQVAAERLCEAIGCDRGPDTSDGGKNDLFVYLHSEGWPFAFRIYGAGIDENGIQLFHNQAKYLHNGEYLPGDPRSNGDLQSNDIWFNAGGSGGILYLNSSGISGTNVSSFAESQGKYAFPKMDIEWQEFELSLNDSEIQLISVESQVSLLQSTFCESCQRSDQVEYVVRGNIVLTGTGLGIGRMLVDGSDVIPTWGNIRASVPVDAFSRPEDLIDGSSTVLALPGFLFSLPAENNGLDINLLGHIGAQANSIALDSILTDAAIDGNGWPIGITVGPEFYRSANGEPRIGGPGRSLEGLALVVNNGVDQFELPVNIGAKYVIRNSGITGVFNVPVDSGLELGFFGYEMEFNRFAFRQTNNKLDTYNWIDGQIDLPGRDEIEVGNADFQIQFTSLTLGCDAKFGQGIVTYCSSPECQQVVQDWNADTDIINMEFASLAGQNSRSCQIENQFLNLEQTLVMNALNEPLNVIDAQWSPEGAILSSYFGPNQDLLLDKKATGETIGFDFSPREGGLKVLSEPAHYGVVDMVNASFVAGEFWQEMRTDIRLRNNEVGAEETVIVASNNLAQIDSLANISDHSNAAIAAGLINNSSLIPLNPDAEHTWLSRFGFSLPVYYSTGASNKQARFTGRYLETDLVIFNAGAGIDYIEPNKTKLSFGASAHIPEVAVLPLNVDISDLESLSKIDSLLDNLGINLNLEETFTVVNPLQPLLGDILALGNNQLDRAIEVQLESILSGIADINIDVGGETVSVNLWQEIAESISMIQSVPLQIDAVIDPSIYEAFSTNLNTNLGVLTRTFTQINNILDDSAIQEEAIVTAELNGRSVKETLLEGIDIIKLQISQLQNERNNLTANLLQGKEHALSIVNQVSGKASSLKDRLDQLDSILSQVISLDQSVCTSENLIDIPDSDIEIILPAITQAKNIDQALSYLNDLDKINELVNILSILFAGESDLAEQFRSTLNDLNSQAQQLKQEWDETESIFRQDICSDSDYLAGVNDTIAGLKSRADEFIQVFEDTAGLPALIENSFDGQIAALDHYGDFSNGYIASLDQAVLTLNSSRVVTVANFKIELETSFTEMSLRLNEIDTGIFFNVESITDENSFATGVAVPFQQHIESLRESLRTSLDEDFVFTGFYYSADDFKEMIVDRIMRSDSIKQIRRTVNRYLQSYVDELIGFQLDINDQINGALRAQLAKTFSPLNDVLADAQSSLPLPVKAASIDGNATIEGDKLSGIHIRADWETASQSDKVKGNKFYGSFDAIRYVNADPSASCGAVEGQKSLEAGITAGGNFDFGGQPTEADVKLGFAFDLGRLGGSAFIPTGLNGSVSILGDVGQSPFVLHDFGFTAGIGPDEAFLGAGGRASFDSASLGLYAFVGKTCDGSYVLGKDLEAAELLSGMFIENEPFAGIYSRGSVAIPIIAGSCALDVTGQVKVGGWVTIEPRAEVGALLGGAVTGRLACIGSVRGQIDMLGTLNTDLEFDFKGRAFAVAGAGFDCDTDSWTSIHRSRGDDWCGTADIGIGVDYINKEWHYNPSFPSVIH